MKKYLYFFSGGVIFIFAAFFFLNNYVGAIVNYSLQNQVVNAASDSVENKGDLFSIKVSNAQQASNVLNPTCMDNYQSWPNSTTFKGNSPWSVAFAFQPLANNSTFQTYTYYNQFERDINGDGLPDYMYIYHSMVMGSYNAYPSQECVYLSNGSGWTKAYQCYVKSTVNPPVFYGDCAQV